MGKRARMQSEEDLFLDETPNLLTYLDIYIPEESLQQNQLP